MSPPNKIDPVEFTEMWKRGDSGRDIAKRFGVTVSGVNAARYRYGLKKRYQAGHELEPVEKQKPDPAVVLDCDSELLATKGSWAKLDALREARGWTATQAQLAFHRERLKVPAVEMMS